MRGRAGDTVTFYLDGVGGDTRRANEPPPSACFCARVKCIQTRACVLKLWLMAYMNE